MAQYLTSESVFESQTVLDHLTGKKKIMNYLNGLGKAMKKHDCLAIASFPAGIEGEYMLVRQNYNEAGVLILLNKNMMVARIDLVLV